MKIDERFENWINSAWIDEKDKQELLELTDEKEIEDRFYKNLEFGTGGMRGVRGVGTNRINKYMIGRATQGLANYMLKVDENSAKKKGVAIAYDCRIGSKEYALETALVLGANGIKSFLFKSLRSTPELSFAVRELGCMAGIVITASHNPVEYNGYKIYWEDGGQIVDPQASGIVEEVNKINDLSNVKKISKKEILDKSLLNYIDEKIDDKYIEEIKKQVINKDIPGKENYKIVYTPLHGTGRVGVQRILLECGFENIYTVPSQEMPDGEFTTCAYANPEDSKVFKLGIELAEDKKANIVMANDPDADRVGIAIKSESGEWIYPNGNQVGLLLMNYILENKKDIPKNAKVISTIVSTPMLDIVAKDKNVGVIRTLTGFKYIGEKIREFEEGKIEGEFLFGFEESYGYLIGTHARDKDGIISAMLIGEMAAYYNFLGLSLEDKLDELYKKYGYYMESLTAIKKEGKEGLEEIENIMKNLRDNPPKEINNIKVKKIKDYSLPSDLPMSNVIQIILEDNTYITIRPSGTEPKIKYYYGVNGKTKEEAENKLKELNNKILNINY
ncbi:MAG: phospho-sugar mutase [Fusobacterium sp. JB019]|nr:phospho-sugar mutase [Fusobacterium sp. JB019]